MFKTATRARVAIDGPDYAAELQNLRGRVGLALRMLRHGTNPNDPEGQGLLNRIVGIVIETLEGEGESNAPV